MAAGAQDREEDRFGSRVNCSRSRCPAGSLMLLFMSTLTWLDLADDRTSSGRHGHALAGRGSPWYEVGAAAGTGGSPKRGR
jgi:hypothetical protein